MVAVSRPCIKFFSFRYRFKALTEWRLIFVVSRSKLLVIGDYEYAKISSFAMFDMKLRLKEENILHKSCAFG